MTSFYFHCGRCCWLPLEPNVVALDSDGARETVTVRCPVCGQTDIHPASPAVHRAVWKHRTVATSMAAHITAQAEDHLRQETPRE